MTLTGLFLNGSLAKLAEKGFAQITRFSFVYKNLAPLKLMLYHPVDFVVPGHKVRHYKISLL